MNRCIFQMNKNSIRNKKKFFSMIELTTEQQHILQELFHTWKFQNHSSYTGPPLELELRFSTFPSDGNNFKPRINTALFHSILEKMECENIQRYETRDTTYIYKVCNESIRKTVADNKNDIWIEKQRKKILDIKQYNVRLSLSSEIPTLPLNGDIKPSYIRKRIRTTFETTICKYDFTLVRTDKSDNNRDICELEIEFNPTTANFFDIVNEMKKMLCLLQNTNSRPVSTKESAYVLNYYCSLMGVGPRVFIGAHPETINKKSLYNLTDHYYGTHKYDGERGLIIVDKHQHMYIIDRKLQVKFIGWSSTASGSVIDAEIVDNRIYLFDLLIDRETDIRDNINFPLERRLNILQSFQFLKQKQADDDYTIQLKPYFQIPCTSKDLDLTMTLETTDGFIFVPCDEPYPKRSKWPNLLKWKPENQNTIDFILKKSNKYNHLYELHIGTNNATCHFHNKYIETSCSPIDISDQIAECNYSRDTKTFSLVKVRLDKTKPNHESVAEQIFASTQDPVMIEDIVKMIVIENGSTPFFDGYQIIKHARWFNMNDDIQFSDNVSPMMPIECLRKSVKSATIHRKSVKITFSDIYVLDMYQKGYTPYKEIPQKIKWQRGFIFKKNIEKPNIIKMEKNFSDTFKLLVLNDIPQFISWITGKPIEYNDADYAEIANIFGISIFMYSKNYDWIEYLTNDPSHTLIFVEHESLIYIVFNLDNNVDFSNKEIRQLIQIAISEKFPPPISEITKKRKFNEDDDDDHNKKKRIDEVEDDMKKIKNVLIKLLPSFPITSLKVYAKEVLHIEIPQALRKKSDIVNFLVTSSSTLTSYP